MDKHIGDELPDEQTMDEPEAEGAAMDGPAKEEISVDEALHVLTRRRWSDAGSELTRPTTATQLKARLNTYYPSQASLYFLVEHIEDLDAKLGRIREGRSEKPLGLAFEAISWLFMFYSACWVALEIIQRMLGPILVLILSYAFLTYSSDQPDSIYASDQPDTIHAIDDPDTIFATDYPDMKGPYDYTEYEIELGEISETDRLRNFKGLMMETLRHRRLEILCRYGDYLAERLGTLRQYISENKLETEHKLSEYWTETSAILRREERQESAPCHNLIRIAAQGLKWEQEVTIFLVHEYAKRNNLMHAELFNLVDRQDWYAIKQRSEEDIEKLRELFIDLDSDSKAAVENWMHIIREFRDRWVRQSKDGSTWEARSIIQEAIMAGVDDRASCNGRGNAP